MLTEGRRESRQRAFVTASGLPPRDKPAAARSQHPARSATSAELRRLQKARRPGRRSCCKVGESPVDPKLNKTGTGGLDHGRQHDPESGRNRSPRNKHGTEPTEHLQPAQERAEALAFTRRHFFGKDSCRHWRRGACFAAAIRSCSPATATGGLPGLPHFAPKAKRVIYLHQSGAPSQIELFDYKPKLQAAARHRTARIRFGRASASPA